jgi:hypothetical protein
MNVDRIGRPVNTAALGCSRGERWHAH